MSAFLFNAPRSLLVHALRSESVRKGYSDLGARISLYLDVDRGRIGTQRQYAEQWGWKRSKVRYHWDAIWQDVTSWALSYGRQMDPEKNPFAGKLPEEWLAWARETLSGPRSHGSEPGPNEIANSPGTAQGTAHQQPKNPRNPAKNKDPQPKNSPGAAQKQPTRDDKERARHPASQQPASEDFSSDQQQQSSTSEAGEVGAADQPVVDVVVRKKKLVLLLAERGVHVEAAGELALRIAEERILRQVRHFDYLCQAGKPPSSAGWLVAAIEQDYALPPALAPRNGSHKVAPMVRAGPSRRRHAAAQLGPGTGPIPQEWSEVYDVRELLSAGIPETELRQHTKPDGTEVWIARRETLRRIRMASRPEDQDRLIDPPSSLSPSES